MQKIKPYVIDLTRVRGKGNVKCPKCGVEISPDDTSEEAYTILEPVVEEERLERIVLQCNRCGSRISLVGFNATS
jgi:ribosomal protein S27AE